MTMSVLIKGMEIPKRGMVVCIHADGRVTNHFDEFGKTKGKAVPVPPHGRLIDADAFCTEHRSLKMLRKVGLRRFNWNIAAAAFVDDAPTIIPASEEGE